MMDRTDLVPFTVVGGFLGAGKTTLINRLIKGTPGIRSAILVNDFGSINIDADLIERHDGRTIELSSGCVCCSLEDDFYGTISRVANAPEPFDRIVIEASGVGDPARVAEIAEIEPRLQRAGIMVLADASRIVEQLNDRLIEDTVRSQLRGAHLVALNKCDLVDQGQLRTARDSILAQCPNAVLVESVKADLAEWDMLPGGNRRSNGIGVRILHEEQFVRWAYMRFGRFHRETFVRTLPQLSSLMLRMKGFCSFVNDDHVWLLQVSGGRWSIEPMLESTGPQVFGPAPIRLVGVGSREAPAAAELDQILDAMLEPWAIEAPGNGSSA